MKLITFLSAAALAGLGVSLLALIFSAQSLGGFAVTASVVVLLGAVRDYAPRHAGWEPRPTRATRFPALPASQVDRLAA
jgi:hypothetical protein